MNTRYANSSFTAPLILLLTEVLFSAPAAFAADEVCTQFPEEVACRSDDALTYRHFFRISSNYGQSGEKHSSIAQK
jgi:hypothetical protein